MKNKISQKLTYWLGVAAVGLIVGLSIQFVLAAWNEPPAGTTPPGGNVGAPINVSDTGQYKAGNLLLNSSGTWANGLIVANGNVGIGTTSPTAKLDVVGSIRLQPTSQPSGANGVMYYDSSLNKFRCYQNGSWADCSGAGSGLTGSGTANHLARWATDTTLGNSLIVDNGTNVGIGISADMIKSNPDEIFHIASNSDADMILQTSVTGQQSGYHTYRSRGTITSPTIVQGGDYVGTFLAMANDGTWSSKNWDSYKTAGGIHVRMEPGATVTASSMPSRIEFATCSSGSSQYAEKMVFDNAGNLGIGVGKTGSVTAKLEVISSAQNSLRLRKALGTAGSVELFPAVGTSTSRTGTALCQTVSGSAICLGHWTSGGSISACGTGLTNSRALCADFGD